LRTKEREAERKGAARNRVASKETARVEGERAVHEIFRKRRRQNLGEKVSITKRGMGGGGLALAHPYREPQETGWYRRTNFVRGLSVGLERSLAYCCESYNLGRVSLLVPQKCSREE